MEQTLTDQLLQAVIQVLLAVFIPLIGTLAAVAVSKVNALLKERLSAEQQEAVVATARKFVLAAEQYNLDGVLTEMGIQKKAWVQERVQEELGSRNIHIDVGAIGDLVEALVMEEFNKIRATPYPVLDAPAG